MGEGVFVSQNFSIVRRDNKWYFLETPLLIGALDKVQEFTLTMLYNVLEDYFHPLQNFSRAEDLEKIHRELTNLRQRLKNSMCKMLKEWDQLPLGMVIAKNLMYPLTQLYDTIVNAWKPLWPTCENSYCCQRKELLTADQDKIRYLISTGAYGKIFG